MEMSVLALSSEGEVVYWGGWRDGAEGCALEIGGVGCGGERAGAGVGVEVHALLGGGGELGVEFRGGQGWGEMGREECWEWVGECSREECGITAG